MSEYLHSFQSLTGSIHTKEEMAVEKIYFRFQSLTGSIHTHFHILKLPKSSFRFNPSQVQFTQITGYLNVNVETKFQSLTGSIHTPDVFAPYPSLIKFQSLTGSIHTYYS